MNNIPNNIKKLALSRELKPTIRIGKSGLTDNLVSELMTQLGSKNLVKINLIVIFSAQYSWLLSFCLDLEEYV